MDAATITAIASISGPILTVLLLGGGGLLWVWKLSGRVDHVSYRIDRLEGEVKEVRQEVRETREELRAEMRSQIHDLREEIRDLRSEMREMREETGRRHEQLLVALAAHSHDEAGQATFRNPL